ncbi:MAG: response regulator [bacterium]|nr:response regulator [bacterium]
MNNDKTGNMEKGLILIVDDVAKNLQVLGSMLRVRGYKISLANSGAQALDIVEARQPDLILLDIMMPEMDGFEVCERLKVSERGRDIPVIFLTARAEMESVVRGFEVGGVDYVTKPFNRSELLVRVETQLRLRAVQREVLELGRRNAVLAMAVTASHELSQPLTVLSGNFQLFQGAFDFPGLTERQRKYLVKMGDSIEGIQDLLKKFTDSGSVDFEKYVGDQEMVVFKND